jgi:hypothetical protein
LTQLKAWLSGKCEALAQTLREGKSHVQGLMIAVQLVVPAALVLWIAFFPGASWLGLCAQVLGTGLAFFAMSQVMLWGLPPRWVLHVFAALWAIGVVWAGAAALRAGLPVMPSGWSGWGTGAIGLILAAAGGALSLQAMASSTPPGSRVIDLSSPLGPGAYLVAHGGSRELTNVHLKTLDQDVPRFANWRGQSYAVDILGRAALGVSRPLSNPSDPAAYPIFDAPVVAPCAGRVIAAEGALPDMLVPEMDRVRKLGNHVILECDGVWVVVAHLRRGSVRVVAGEPVAQGAPLGKVGNSGNSSEPHLHLHVQTPGRADTPIAGAPIPFRVDGRYLVRNDILLVAS